MDSRDAVAEVMEKLSSEAAEPASDTQETAAPETAAEPESAPEGADRADSSAPVRGPDGKFAKAGKAKPLARESAVAGAPDSPPDAAPAAPSAPVLPEIKAPQELKAAIKEKWSSFPREVQEALSESYLHKQKVMSETAQSRKAAEEWQQTVAPFAHAFNGAPPHQVVGSLLRAWGTLNTGHPQERAQVIAEIIRGRLGSDEQALRLLATALEAGGTAPAPQAQPLQTAEQIRQLVREERQAADQADRKQQADRLLSDFKADAEFFDKVQPELQALASSWRARNPDGVVTKEILKQWYDRACEVNDETAPVIRQRKLGAAAKNPNGPPAAAAVGIKHEAAGPSGATGPAKNTAEEVRRQMARISGRARV